jgi:hypothetical protein
MNASTLTKSAPKPVRGDKTFKHLLKIGMNQWTYQDCLSILNDINPNIRKIAQYVIDHKYIVGVRVEEYADLVDA